jgi:hypothetical protein
MIRHFSGPVRRILNVLLSAALTSLGLTRVTFFIGRIVPIDEERGHSHDQIRLTCRFRKCPFVPLST